MSSKPPKYSDTGPPSILEDRLRQLMFEVVSLRQKLEQAEREARTVTASPKYAFQDDVDAIT
jgi:hypothetical protein